MVNFSVPYSLYHLTQGSQPHWTANQTGPLDFTDRHLARALLLTGRHYGIDHVRRDPLGRWEYKHKLGFTRAYFQSAPHSHTTPRSLSLTTLASSLDRTEKGYMSYSLGQALTGIFCQDVLSVARMLHFDIYKEGYGLTAAPSGPRPDLFGRARNRLVIAEAKGRTTDNLKDVVRVGGDTIRQLGAVRVVRTSPPLEPRLLRSMPKSCRASLIGCVAMVSPSRDAISLHVFDHGPHMLRVNKVHPGGLEGVRGRLDYRLVSLDRFLLDFYSGILSLIESDDNDAIAEEGIFKVRLAGLGVTVGLLGRLREVIARRRDLVDFSTDGFHGYEPVGLTDEVRMILGEADLELAGMFPDGTFFETDWPEAIEG